MHSAAHIRALASDVFLACSMRVWCLCSSIPHLEEISKIKDLNSTHSHKGYGLDN